jgi:hypothetical protein
MNALRTSIVVVLCLLGGVVRAHSLDAGYLRVDAEGSALAITFDFDVAVAGELLRVDSTAVDAALATRAEELAESTYRTAAPTNGDTACSWGKVTATRKGQTVTLTERATCPGGDLRWDLAFVKRLAATFQILGRVRAHGAVQMVTIDKTRTSIAIAGARNLLRSELWNGMAATGLLPRGWPNGLAMVLIVIALVVAAPNPRAAVMTVGTVIVGVVGGAFAFALPRLVLALGLALAIAGVTAVAAIGRRDHLLWGLGLVIGVLSGGASAASPHVLGFAAGFALGVAAIALVIGPPLALTRSSLERHVPLAAVVTGLGAIALVLKAWVG